MASTIQRVNESSLVNKFFITINGYDIPANYILDYQLDYLNTFKITGYITINDIFDMVTSLLKNPKEKIKVTLIDAWGESFTREFYTTSSSEVKEQDSKMVKFDIQDTISFTLNHTFKSKSYQQTTLLDVFKDYLNTECKDFITGIPTDYENTRTINNFVVPSSEDFLTFISREFDKEGIFFYQDKQLIKVGNKNQPETEYVYKQVGAPEYYGFVIIEYQLIHNDINKTNSKLPKTVFLSYDKTTKSMTKYDKSLSDYGEDFNTGGVFKNSQITNGVKYVTKEYLVDDTKYRHLEYKNNTMLAIVVPGNIKYNLLNKPIIVQLSGNINSKETLNKGDMKLSGKYEILRIYDKIASGNRFIQKMDIRRVNEGKILNG